MLPTSRVKVERSCIGHIAACVIRNDGDVVTDLVLVRIPFEWVERIAHRDIRRPRYARVGAKGVK